MGLDTGLTAAHQGDRSDHAWTGRMIAPETDTGVNGRASFVAATFSCTETKGALLRMGQNKKRSIYM